jgi:serine/threonine protein kinase
MTGSTMSSPRTRYRVDGLLDRGGMSEVYHGYDERLDRHVAIKVLRPPTHAPAAPERVRPGRGLVPRLFDILSRRREHATDLASRHRPLKPRIGGAVDRG